MFAVLHMMQGLGKETRPEDDTKFYASGNTNQTEGYVGNKKGKGQKLAWSGELSNRNGSLLGHIKLTKSELNLSKRSVAIGAF
mgnify:CR=1 FL=1|jgi:hypothetical protein